MRQISLISGAVALLATAGCSAGSSDVSQSPPPGASLAGSTTPGMASVTGRQSLGMYDPMIGTTVYGSPTPPPGRAYGR